MQIQKHWTQQEKCVKSVLQALHALCLWSQLGPIPTTSPEPEVVEDRAPPTIWVGITLQRALLGVSRGAWARTKKLTGEIIYGLLHLVDT